MNFREANKIARKKGWYEVGQTGSHHHYKHPTEQGKLTLPEHGGRDYKKKTEESIKKWLGLK